MRRAWRASESAIRRAKIYKDAGADVVFPDALASADEFRRFADELARLEDG